MCTALHKQQLKPSFMDPGAPTIVSLAWMGVTAAAKAWSRGSRKEILAQTQPQTSVGHGCVSNSAASHYIPQSKEEDRELDKSLY